MTSNINISSDQVDDELYEELLYEVLLYKKKDIIAIQKKLGMVLLGSINDITNQTALNESKGKYLKIHFDCSLIW
jgi:hypothetical protein